MIDIHSHLLYGVDDGSTSLEESLEILKNLNQIGFTDIILTPHYMQDTDYASPKKENLKKLKILQDELNKNNINIKLYLGNEIYINNNIEKLIKKDEISSLNDTEYLLIELPMSGRYSGYLDIFEDLIISGYKVILAHPERYIAFQKDYEMIEELEELGVYFQCNLESILGRYGESAKKTIKKLLKEKKVSFLATDIHHNKSDYGKLEKAKSKIKKYLKGDIEEILVKNPSKIINN